MTTFKNWNSTCLLCWLKDNYTTNKKPHVLFVAAPWRAVSVAAAATWQDASVRRWSPDTSSWLWITSCMRLSWPKWDRWARPYSVLANWIGVILCFKYGYTFSNICICMCIVRAVHWRPGSTSRVGLHHGRAWGSLGSLRGAPWSSSSLTSPTPWNMTCWSAMSHRSVFWDEAPLLLHSQLLVYKWKSSMNSYVFVKSINLTLAERYLLFGVIGWTFSCQSHSDKKTPESPCAFSENLNNV